MCEAHGEHRHQALTAGQDLRVVAVLGEQIDGLVDGLRTVIDEGGGLHDTSRDSAASMVNARW